jgi:hypothetical protein
MNIKTWVERAESLSDDTVVTSLHLAQFKQDEIDELRKENARLRDALLKLYVAAPTTLECHHFHHSKSEQRHPLGECGPARDYLKSLNAARAALGES